MRRVRWAMLALSGSLLMLSGCCWNLGWRAAPCCPCDPCCCGSPAPVAGCDGPALAQPEPFLAPGTMPPPMFPSTPPPPLGAPMPTPMPTNPPPRIVPVPQAPTTPYTPTGMRKWRRW